MNSNFWFDDGRALSPRLRRILDRYVLDHLQHTDTTHSGPLPAPQSAINNLRTFRVPDDMSDSKWNQCAVCKDKFETGEVVTELPCKHLYHKDCILPWLEIHNTCPVCREGLTSTDGIRSESGAEAEQRPVRMSSVFDRDPGEAGSSGGESDEENWRLIRLSLVFRFRLSEEEETVQERSDGQKTMPSSNELKSDLTFSIYINGDSKLGGDVIIVGEFAPIVVKLSWRVFADDGDSGGAEGLAESTSRS
ncbi:43kDa postsynaptic protein [Trema orientale]|uniref:RING-type E3 ubiquitin transferase n=1 Tax=Trema orientale TaxID=63057 RepID=A0A2P5F0A3_TREOI|nr:43kDa postsynaptic protein [Trema orientale]